MISDMNSEDEKLNRRKNGWTINKEVSVGDLIAFITAFLAVVAAYFTLDKRITLVETAVIAQAKVDMAQDVQRKDMATEIKAGLLRLESKLDAIVDRRLDGKR